MRNTMFAPKRYCYVDETGQDTQGDLFIVAVVVVVDLDRDQALADCEAIEQASGKGQRKWLRSRPAQRVAYVERVLQTGVFHGKLAFAVYRNSKEYVALTCQTIARAILAQPDATGKVTVLIDGLPQVHRREVGKYLRQQGIQVRKVRGIRDEENDALCRLADAVCGFVRAALENQEPFSVLLAQGQSQGVLVLLEEEV
jgi:alkanesulfonate monooxygenase SsuD/methylene tetrahydromethanopterin reductase-like flavin-dependent oxidoreductase (luciferase family)